MSQSENKLLLNFTDVTCDNDLKYPNRKLQCRVKKSHNGVELERCTSTHGEPLEIEGKLRILSESRLNAIISFTCESNISYGGYSQIGSSQTLDKHTFKRRFQQSY